MTTKLKIIEPPVIEITPLNEQVGQFDNNSSSTSSLGTTSEEKTEWRQLPPPQYAHEVISRRLNTVSGQITSQFKFTEFGAIRIGVEGETGFIEITGNGIVAKNINGNNTFTLDGRSGDAYFSGELAAGSIMTGQIDMGVDGFIIGGDASTYRWILGKLPS